MSDDVNAGIVQVISGKSFGTGFIVSDDGLIATCAHVVGNPCPERVTVIFLATNEQREATVQEQWLRGVEAEDVAILRLEGSLPPGVKALLLGSSTGVSGHKVSTFGFPSAGDVEGVAGYGRVLGRGSQTKAGQPLLQIRSSEITSGFSGGPVWDELRQRVIGQVVMVATPDYSGKMGETAFATPIETLQSVCPELQIPDINPYSGLDPFTQAQARYFSGRKAEVDRVVNKLRLDPRLLVIIGPSGSGKSSLIAAGLLPQLREGIVPGSDRWEILMTRPGDNPFAQLAALGLAVESPNLVDALREWLKQHPTQSQMVLIFDQFEELLTTKTDSMARDFLTQVTMALEERLPVTVLMVMRDDSYSSLAQHAKFMEWIERSQGLISMPATLGWESLAAIVQAPAKSIGLRFEEGLVEQIVEDLIESQVSEEGERVGRSALLPLLEFALTELCERREDGVLTFKAYEKIGGVTGGLRQWADSVFNTLEDERKRQLASRIFTDLVYLGDERQNLADNCRRRVLRLLSRNEGEREEIYELVRRLVDARLLVTRYDTQSNEVIVEIIHEALLREWGQLKWWLKNDRPFLLWHQELEKKAQAWKSSSASNSSLIARFLKGSGLSEAEGWMRLRAGDLSQEEQDFIKASRAQKTQEDLRWKQLYEDAEAQRQEAERLRQEAEKQRQEAERQKVEAEQQRWEAERLRQEAEKQREEAIKQHQEAERLRLEAERERQIALARQLTAQAELMRNSQPSLLQRSVLLAVEAVQLSPSPEADATLRAGLALLPHPVASVSPRDEVSAAALSADGHSFILAYKDRNVEVWDVGGAGGEAGSRVVLRLLHEVEVKYVAFSLDGRSFFTIGTDSIVRVWDTAGGRQVAMRIFSSSSLSTVVLSRSGRLLVATGGDGRVWIWEIPTNRQLSFLASEGILYAASFSQDERYLVTAGVDSVARVWDVLSGRKLASLHHEIDGKSGRSVSAAAFSPDGRYLATASEDDCVRLWKWSESSASPYAILSHESTVNAVTFSPDGIYLATACKDNNARVWETSSGRLITHMAQERSVNSVVFSADGRYLATTSADRTVGVWEALSGYRLVCLPIEGGPASHPGNADAINGVPTVNAVAFSPDGRYFTTVREDGAAGQWEIINTRFLHKRRVSAVLFHPEGRYLATASEDGTAGVWETMSGYRQRVLSAESKLWALAFSPNGRILVMGSEDGKACLWETLGGRKLLCVTHSQSVNAVAFSADGRSLATASSDSTAKVWETTSGRLIFDLLHDDMVNSVVFSPDGRFLATASNDASGRLWELAGGRQVAVLPHKMIVSMVTFSPDGRYVATASWDYTARIWEAASGRLLFRLLHESKVWSVAFSPDSTCIATASNDSTAAIWEVSSGKQLLRLIHDDSVSAVTFSPNGKYVATASEDGTAGVWERASGRRLSTLTHEPAVTAVTFSPDGKYVATASMDGTARLWLWRSVDLLAKARTRLTRNLTQEEWQQYLGNENPMTKKVSLPSSQG